MKNKIVLFLCLISLFSFSQEKDSTKITYKKRVLESIEVDFLASYYKQDGIHSAVSGGKGMEDLTDITPTIVVAVPLNDDDVLTVDVGISAYSSASSGNINPFDSNTPSPWQASSGASAQDALTTLVLNYSHSSDDRNTIWNGHISGSIEYDYSSIGFGGGLTKLFNDKNTEVNLSANVYLDTWSPIYPKELQDFVSNGNNLNGGIFNNFTITGNTIYNPEKFSFHEKKNRNSYAVSLSFSQILTRKLQFSLFLDVLQQQGLLSTPYQRIYFSDIDDSFINEFQLADDIERLPDTRFKLPIGTRLNYYINERLVIRTYYRYYTDNWDIKSHTASIELPVKLSDRFTVFPMYRYYTQNQSKYFAPHEAHLSTEKYYTSDYDLSTFDANQYGFGVNYTDIFTSAKIWKFGIKNIDLRYNYYKRSDGLDANIIFFGIKFVQ
ncbi:DUF3570 domain-containing protein [Flavobacterium sediminilitoris]|uniref:DUF3570 domain-containing protein n=1 Tax=Flavobacterium sediminilitoris TaxID=2024526 RepID=A0ABY4HK75_9FLAO|nr:MULTISPECIES: DUF3570 domain-containing protein [Flavobacterium]UOX33252.1 DUF3570 domain-containing protein [Flavobacterium sediminilitoris]